MSLALVIPLMASSLVSVLLKVTGRNLTLHLISYPFSALGALSIVKFGPESSTWHCILSQSLFGLGVGLAGPFPFREFVFRDMPAQVVAKTTQTWLGEAIGVAIAHAIFLTTLRRTMPVDIPMPHSIMLGNRTTSESSEMITIYDKALTYTLWSPVYVSSSLAIFLFMVFMGANFPSMRRLARTWRRWNCPCPDWIFRGWSLPNLSFLLIRRSEADDIKGRNLRRRASARYERLPDPDSFTLLG